jgi:hypothetical protein
LKPCVPSLLSSLERASDAHANFHRASQACVQGTSRISALAHARAAAAGGCSRAPCAGALPRY